MTQQIEPNASLNIKTNMEKYKMSEYTSREAAYDSLTPEELEIICDMAHGWTVGHCQEEGIKVWVHCENGSDLRYSEQAQYIFNMYHDEAETQFVEGTSA